MRKYNYIDEKTYILAVPGILKSFTLNFYCHGDFYFILDNESILSFEIACHSRAGIRVYSFDFWTEDCGFG